MENHKYPLRLPLGELCSIVSPKDFFRKREKFQRGGENHRTLLLRAPLVLSNIFYSFNIYNMYFLCVINISKYIIRYNNMLYVDRYFM